MYICITTTKDKMTKLTTLLLLGVSTFSIGQSNELELTKQNQASSIGTNIERYNVEYNLEDESIIVSDSSILNTLNLNILDFNRTKDEDVTVFDRNSGLSIVVYSYNKILSIKSEDSPHISK